MEECDVIVPGLKQIDDSYGTQQNEWAEYSLWASVTQSSMLK